MAVRRVEKFYAKKYPKFFGHESENPTGGSGSTSCDSNIIANDSAEKTEKQSDVRSTLNDTNESQQNTMAPEEQAGGSGSKSVKDSAEKTEKPANVQPKAMSEIKSELENTLQKTALELNKSITDAITKAFDELFVKLSTLFDDIAKPR